MSADNPAVHHCVIVPAGCGGFGVVCRACGPLDHMGATARREIAEQFAGEHEQSNAATPSGLSPEDEKRPVVAFLRVAEWPESEIAKVVEAHKRGETPTYKVTL